MRLDKFLADKNKEYSRSKIQKAIKDGLVLVNGKKVLEPDFQVKANDKVVLPEFEEEKLSSINYHLSTIFENEDLAVIDKPAGLMVHPAAGRTDDTLAHALLSRFTGIEKVGDPHRPGIVHRLDEDTSGLLLIAKTQSGYDYLKNLFQTRNIEKEYLALVHGVPERLHGVIDAPIGKASTHQKMRVGVGKEAITEYRVLAEGHLRSAFAKATADKLDRMALLLVKLHTGRTHQIRVHMAHIGHPVVGDELYGGHFKKSDSELIGRQFLHAHRLKFQLQDGTWLELVSELPDDLKQALNKLGIKLI